MNKIVNKFISTKSIPLNELDRFINCFEEIINSEKNYSNDAMLGAEIRKILYKTFPKDE